MKLENKLIGHFVKAVRGRKSQGYINLKFGKKSNIVANWESGKSRILWSEFVLVSELSKIAIREKIRTYYAFQGDITEPKEFLYFLFGGKKEKEIAKLTGFSYHKLLRISSGKSPLYFIDLLRLIEKIGPFQLLSFLSQFIPTGKVKSYDDAQKTKQQIVDLTYNEPMLATIYSAIKLKSYTKSKGKGLDIIAREAGLQPEKAKILIQQMYDLKLIKDQDGKIQLTGTSSADDRGNPDGTRRVRSWWLHAAIRALENQANLPSQEKDSFGSIVFHTTYKTRQKIISLYLKFFEDMKREVLSDKDEAEIIQVLAFQLFNPKHSAIK